MLWTLTTILMRLVKKMTKREGKHLTLIAPQVETPILKRLWRRCFDNWAKRIDHLIDQWGTNKL